VLTVSALNTLLLGLCELARLKVGAGSRLVGEGPPLWVALTNYNGPHNAGVEGSSPFPSTSSLRARRLVDQANDDSNDAPLYEICQRRDGRQLQADVEIRVVVQNERSDCE